MLESFNTQREMQYERLSAEEQQKRGILGRLVGIIADFKNPTRNGRRYTEELWDKTFSDPIMKEKLDNRCVFGELGHPADRTEIDMEKIAICLAEMPKKGNDGKLYGVFDILNTPNGRILKTMCDYGCNIGVSSRGSGDTFEDYNGQETVEPDSFECECWDAVLLPAVKAARPKYVTESLNTNTKTFKTALLEELDRSNEDERKVMEQTLNELDIDVTDADEADVVTEEVSTQEDNVAEENNPPEKVDNINTDEETETTDMAAEDVRADGVNELLESLKRQRELEDLVQSLQEKLSVCYTKESRYSDRLGKAKSALEAEQLKNNSLAEEIARLNTKIKSQNSANVSLQKKVAALTEQVEAVNATKTTLNEKLSTEKTSVKTLQEQMSTLVETHKTEIKTLEEEKTKLISDKQKLTEDIQSHKKDLQIHRSQSTAQIEKAKQLVEKYKSIAKTAVDKYISLQAQRCGVPVAEIKKKLSENYSFNDIDKVCESLQEYRINVSTLPFSVSKDKPVKMQLKESVKKTIGGTIEHSNNYGVDDDIDATLMNIVK